MQQGPKGRLCTEEEEEEESIGGRQGPRGHRGRESRPRASLAGEWSPASCGRGWWEPAVGCPRNSCGCRGISRAGVCSFAGLRGGTGDVLEAAWQQAGGLAGVSSRAAPSLSPWLAWRGGGAGLRDPAAPPLVHPKPCTLSKPLSHIPSQEPWVQGLGCLRAGSVPVPHQQPLHRPLWIGSKPCAVIVAEQAAGYKGKKGESAFCRHERAQALLCPVHFQAPFLSGAPPKGVWERTCLQRGSHFPAGRGSQQLAQGRAPGLAAAAASCTAPRGAATTENGGEPPGWPGVLCLCQRGGFGICRWRCPT